MSAAGAVVGGARLDTVYPTPPGGYSPGVPSTALTDPGNITQDDITAAQIAARAAWNTRVSNALNAPDPSSETRTTLVIIAVVALAGLFVAGKALK